MKKPFLSTEINRFILFSVKIFSTWAILLQSVQLRPEKFQPDFPMRRERAMRKRVLLFLTIIGFAVIIGVNPITARAATTGSIDGQFQQAGFIDDANLLSVTQIDQEQALESMGVCPDKIVMDASCISQIFGQIADAAQNAEISVEFQEDDAIAITEGTTSHRGQSQLIFPMTWTNGQFVECQERAVQTVVANLPEVQLICPMVV
jgi:hypothetical protein